MKKKIMRSKGRMGLKKRNEFEDDCRPKKRSEFEEDCRPKKRKEFEEKEENNWFEDEYRLNGFEEYCRLKKRMELKGWGSGEARVEIVEGHRKQIKGRRGSAESTGNREEEKDLTHLIHRPRPFTHSFSTSLHVTTTHLPQKYGTRLSGPRPALKRLQPPLKGIM